MFWNLFTVTILSGLILLTGCNTNIERFGRHPDFDQRYQQLKVVSAPTPDIDLMQLTAGGEQIKHDEWTQNARASITAGLDRLGKLDKLDILTSEIPEHFEDELREINKLFTAIRLSVANHVNGFPVNHFPHKREHFTYSVGPIHNILEETGGDALLLIQGFDQFSTGGRKSLMALGVIAGSVTGVVIIPGAGQAHVSAALIDANGDILWMESLMQVPDLRSKDQSELLLQQLLGKFPQL